jgi:hypothetical protein
MWKKIIPTFVVVLMSIDISSCTKNREEFLVPLKDKIEDEHNGQWHNMLDSIPEQPSRVLLESYDYPFTVYSVPKAELKKPEDPVSRDFHMTRFSFGNPHYISSGNKFSHYILYIYILYIIYIYYIYNIYISKYGLYSSIHEFLI